MIPRSEYPRPQFVRDRWINLNGEWEFEFDFGLSGLDRKFYEAGTFSKKITVPFCPESELSGIGYKDFMNGVWYRREVELQKGCDRLLLHFGAVDYGCHVWVNQKPVGVHKGGYSSFTFDITDAAVDGVNVITVFAKDETRSGNQPRGKQSGLYYSHACDYTRTTGIWQTVWIEPVAQTYIQSSRIITDDLNPKASVTIRLFGDPAGVTIRLTASYNGKPMGCVCAKASAQTTILELPLAELHLWEVGNGRLYDLTYELLLDDVVIDRAQGYFGVRTVLIEGDKILINHKPVFQRLVLDQGFYPDGIYTAPTDDALKRDIELSLAAGFNGARLHQKVFEERFLYWADRLGYIVWGEEANWGLDISTCKALAAFVPEWLEVMERDFNHPAIVGWCPLNETSALEGVDQDDDVLRVVYQVTKAYDPTRPVIDTSGFIHVVTDIYDIHDYEQSVEVFRERFQKAEEGDYYDPHAGAQQDGGQPNFVSEYGGTWWAPGNENGWGYGDAPKTEEEFGDRYEGLTTALLDCKKMCAFCYTQLTDIEQECNGLYHNDRSPKFSEKIYKQIFEANQKRAAIEEE